MLTLVFTYHQVLPSFLDFLFPFGNQQYAQDSHFSGFKYEDRFSDVDSGLRIPELGWSGRDFQFCYNLRSIESSKGQPEWPWSIRQSALYHSFDVETGRTNWIVIKGDQLLKKRIKSATGSRGLPATSRFATVDRAFASTLAIHVIMCEWSGENWRWYINFLEEALQATTRPTLSAMVDQLPSSMADEGPSTLGQCADSNMGIPLSRPILRRPSAQAYHLKDRPILICNTLSDIDLASQELDYKTLQRQVTTSHHEFSFSDLQRIHFIQEKANETLLVLKLNVEVLTELRQHYRSICESVGWPRELTLKCKSKVFRFEKRVIAVENDLRMQQSRSETLLRLLADRKSLLYGILEYRNMEASKTLAQRANRTMEASKELAGKAHESTRNMEAITREMHIIAQKTKQETVSMRIITLVTLFFLPGTFISTLMSTDIFKATNTGQFGNTVQLGTLRLYIAISLPLVVVTLLAWYGVYWWETRKEKLLMKSISFKSHTEAKFHAIAGKHASGSEAVLRMVEPQPDNNQHIQDLMTWAEKARQLGAGHSGLEIDQLFIPYPDVEAYFRDIQTIKKLLAALFPNGVPHVDPEMIRKKYAKVFLILLLTGNGRFIGAFVRHDSLCDQYLPFRSRPERFPQKAADTDFFTSFYRRQWEFCVPIFQHAMNLQFDEKDLILPIISKEKIGGGGSAIVYKIKLHPAYNNLSRESPSQKGSIDHDPHTFVLKTYNAPDAERYYSTEVSGFSNLKYSGGLNTNIIGFHGSFIRDGAYNVLLEYADRGNLEEFFDTIQPPSSAEDIEKFWRELFKMLRALVAIHSVESSDSAASPCASISRGYSSTSTLHRDLAYVSRWHQDVKPSNILVKSKKGGSPHDYELKLGDLGTSHFKKHVPSHGEATDRDSYSTHTYGGLYSNGGSNFTVADGSSGAPECYRADSDIEKIPLLVKQGVDIWSLGCIFSEAAVWVVHGKDGLSEYRRRRGMETAQIPGFRDGNCFHDGERVLATVTENHRHLAHDIRACDHVTRATVRMVTKEMLIESDCRTPAKSLSYRTKGILHDAETKLRRPAASYAVTGSVSETVTQSPPRTPPEPPPGHVQPRSSKSHSQRLPSYTYAGSVASTSYDENEAHHRKPGDDLFGTRASQQVYYSDRPIQRSSIGLVNHPSYPKYEGQDQFSGNHLNHAFSQVDLSQDNPSSPSWQEALGTQRRRRRTPSDSFSGANTRNGPDTFAQNLQKTYNDSQRNSCTAPPRGVSRSSTATVVQDLHNGSRAGQHRPNIASGTRPPRLESYNVPPPVDTQPRRRPPFLSLNVAQQWKSDRKQHKPVKLPDHHLLAHLNERDHVFLIDNSLSMKPHRREVCDLFGLLGYIVKPTDPDGIELQFTMSPERNNRARNTGHLLRNLETVPFLGISNIRTQLGEILQDYQTKLRDQKSKRTLLSRMRSPRPVRRQTVYLLTDGVWQPACDPTKMIKDLANSLEPNHMEREQFGIQFIRFGDDPVGINRLNQLDSGLGLSMDIVDTEPSNGNVWKMLLGAVNDWFDDDDVSASSSAVASPVFDTTPGMNALHHFGR
ncbi:MAG: hypothetical protein Q9175_006779 [Cornicularia normoerica]